MKQRFVGIWLVLLACVFAGCDHLDDGDGGLANELLPGQWAFSYTIRDDVDPGMSFEYKMVIFNEDGTCAITYDGGELTGTYQTSASMIRIVSYAIDGKEHVLIWRIVSLSATRVVTEYTFEYAAGQYATAVVTLEKQL